MNQAHNDGDAVNLSQFIRDIRRELGHPGLLCVISETGMTGHNDKHPRALSLMAAQAEVAQMPESRKTVSFVGTKDFYREPSESPSAQGYHWNSNAETCYLIGEAMGGAACELID